MMMLPNPLLTHFIFILIYCLYQELPIQSEKSQSGYAFKNSCTKNLTKWDNPCLRSKQSLPYPKCSIRVNNAIICVISTIHVFTQQLCTEHGLYTRLCENQATEKTFLFRWKLIWSRFGNPRSTDRNLERDKVNLYMLLELLLTRLAFESFNSSLVLVFSEFVLGI
jgi:hypothetical protein